jgi:genome maintenance exonuclease 1
MFNLDLIELPTLIRHDGESRYYETPTGQKYPSVTTVLDKTSDKSFLHKWRARVGAEEADKITKRAANRGTAVHLLCEKLVLNEPYDLNESTALHIHLFTQLKPLLVNHVDNVRLSEGSLHSHKLKIAGSVDLVSDWDGVPSIVDFKTSLKNKRKDWIENYFLQTTLYSMMLYELTGIMCKQLVICIAIEEENQPQVFVENISDWMPKAIRRCKQYHELFEGR